MAFDEAWAAWTVDHLRRHRPAVAFADGLDDGELASIEHALGVPLPPELAVLFRTAFPISPGWANWRADPQRVVADGRDWIRQAFAFDIEHGGYWHDSFGPRPPEHAGAIEQALAVVHEAAPLVPLYGHRFLSTVPADGPRPVLSVWQALDTIVYGEDLADYLAAEFGIPRPTWWSTRRVAIPVWGSLFDLDDLDPP